MISGNVIAAIIVLIVLIGGGAALAVLTDRDEQAEQADTGASTWAPGVTVVTVPELRGHQYEWSDDDTRHRVWTVAHGLDFDAVPDHDDGGPATVTVGGWQVSTMRLCAMLSSPSVVAADDGKYQLNLWRGSPVLPDRHPLDGNRYASQRDADRAAYEAGALGFMVYQRDAERFGLPH